MMPCQCKGYMCVIMCSPPHPPALTRHALLIPLPTTLAMPAQLTLIDFPQMVSVSHANAQDMFDRDVECIVKCVAARSLLVLLLNPTLQQFSRPARGAGRPRSPMPHVIPAWLCALPWAAQL